MEMMKVVGRAYPIAGYVAIENLYSVPLVDIPMMTDYKWHLLSLHSRLADPEFYRTVLGEDVDKAVTQLQELLRRYDDQPIRHELPEAG